MKKTRSWFWFFIQLLPLLIVVFFMISRIGQGAVQYASINSFLADCFASSSHFRVSFVFNALSSVCDVFGASSSSSYGLGFVLSLISYEIFVLFMRICYEVIAFLPKFCISFFERKV